MTIDQQKSTSSGKEGTGTPQYHVNSPGGAGTPKGPGSKEAPRPSPVRPVIKGDDYPYKNSQPDFDGGDRWGFYARECTSFVAHRINQLGVNFTNGMRGPKGAPTDHPIPVWGNGDHWAEHANNLGFRVDNTPSVGAIAHFDPGISGAGSMGHVAYVAQVNGDGTIVIEEYNFAFAYAYR